jgi:anti-anti-sigma factor
MPNVTVISMSLVGEIAYLTIRGRLVAGSEAAAMRETILRAGPNFELLVVNLRDLQQIDAAGLGELVFAYSAARNLGARFRLAAVTPPVGRMLAVTRLETILCPSGRKVETIS